MGARFIDRGAVIAEQAATIATVYCALGWDPAWVYDLGDHPSDLEVLHEQIHSTTQDERLQYEAAIRMALAAPWTVLDLTRPSAHLRELAALSLADAAARLGVAGPTSVHTAERREAGKGLRGDVPGLCTLATILARAAAYGLRIEVRVRRQR